MRNSRAQRYIDTRIEQLGEDMARAHDEHDKAWYKRCIQELEWVQQMHSGPTHNCFIEKLDAKRREVWGI